MHAYNLIYVFAKETIYIYIYVYIKIKSNKKLYWKI